MKRELDGVAAFCSLGSTRQSSLIRSIAANVTKCFPAISSASANTFRDPITVSAGTQPYTCLNKMNMAPMGNSVGTLTALDPVDRETLWATQQWANDAAPCVWNTRIVGYKVRSAKR